MNNDTETEITHEKGNDVLETISEFPEIEIENEVGATGESDVSQSTLAVSEDSTINTEDFTIYEDADITVKESDFIEIETALKSVGETFNEIEKNIAEIEEDIKQSEVEISAMELEMLEIEKTYMNTEEISCPNEALDNSITVEDNDIVRYFADNFIPQQLIKCQQLIGVLFLTLKLRNLLIRDIILNTEDYPWKGMFSSLIKANTMTKSSSNNVEIFVWRLITNLWVTGQRKCVLILVQL